MRKQAIGLVYNKKQQRQLQEEIRWSQVEYFVIFSVNYLLHLSKKDYNKVFCEGAGLCNLERSVK